jgi:hypothetical protein
MRAPARLKRHGGCRRALIDLAQDLLEPREHIAIFILLISYAAVGECFGRVFGAICQNLPDFIRRRCRTRIHDATNSAAARSSEQRGLI